MPTDAREKKERLKQLRAQLDGIEKRFSRDSVPASTGERADVVRDLRRRLDTQTAAQVAPSTQAPRAIVYARELKAGRSGVRAPASEIQSAQYRVTIEDAFPEGREVVTPHGHCFEIEKRIRELNPSGTLDPAFSMALARVDSPLCLCLNELLEPADLAVQDFIFMDIETTGLNSSPLFLIGIMTWEGDGFAVRQFFARSYAEEAAVVHRFLETCRQRRVLVTFNGKSFDMPYIRTRAAALRLRVETEPAHLDLLHVSRRCWKERLPDCKLQTLERHICGRRRHGDIPGSEIPEAYHAYVRTSDAWQMVEALKHNMLDLVTLADLLTRLPSL